MGIEAALLELAEAFCGMVPAYRRLQLPVVPDCIGFRGRGLWFRVDGVAVARASDGQ